MCRLFGLYANRSVDVEFSWRSLEELSKSNPDGWGIAWFDGNSWHLHKEPGPLYKSQTAKDLVKRVRGYIIVSHVRRATHGGLKLENTHPWLYKGYVFAHNGIINRDKILKLLRQEYMDLEGETDSEVFFHLIVQEVESSGDFVEGVKRAIAEINSNGINYSSLNFIASDGRKLYALRYESLNYYTLYYLKRPTEGLRLEHLSKETYQLVRAKLAVGEKAVLVASEPLTEEPWEEVPNKHLLIADESLNTELVEIG
jgi:glutamine amidotransferase